MGRVGAVSRTAERVSDSEQKTWSLDFGDWSELHIDAGVREREGEGEGEGERGRGRGRDAILVLGRSVGWSLGWVVDLLSTNIVTPRVVLWCSHVWRRQWWECV